jgi:hypothetical protein
MSRTLLSEGAFDLFLMYQFVKKLVTPFNETKAYELGLIDDNGKVLKKRNQLKSQEEKNAFTLIDVIAFNLRKILHRFPGGKSKIASYAAAMWLMKEGRFMYDYDHEHLTESFTKYYDENIDSNFLYDAMILIENTINKKSFTKSDAREIGDKHKVDFDKYDLEEFRKGLEVELEHDDPEYDTVNSESDLVKIVLAHLNEKPNYYTLLAKHVEEEGIANAVGDGSNVALDEPIVKKKPKKLIRKKKIRNFKEYVNYK